MDSEIQYKIIESEFDGLCLIASKGKLHNKLFISHELIGESGLQIWNWQDKTYYTKFIEENLEQFLIGIEQGYYNTIYDGYSINSKHQSK